MDVPVDEWENRLDGWKFLPNGWASGLNSWTFLLNGWASRLNGWMFNTKRVSKSFKWLDVNFYCTGNQGIRTDANFLDHMTQVTWTNANFFQTASEWNFVWKWKAVNVCFCMKGHKFCRTIVTSHVKTDTNGYQFEWLKTVCLPFALHFLINKKNYCHLFMIDVMLFKQIWSSIQKNFHLFEWLLLSVQINK